MAFLLCNSKRRVISGRGEVRVRYDICWASAFASVYLFFVLSFGISCITWSGSFDFFLYEQSPVVFGDL